jgi:hypothetical protein
MTWPQVAQVGVPNNWWESVVAAPSDTQIVYASGYFTTNMTKTFELMKSADGGKTFTPMGVDPTTGLTTSENSLIDIVAIDPVDPKTFYITISVEDGMHQYGLWKTINAGDSFTEIRSEQGVISAALRMDGDLVVGTQLFGAHVSHDGGTNWDALVSPPHINCLRESPTGELWACTANYGSMALTPDPGGIMKTTDLMNWTNVLHFQDITDPVSCPGGTPEADVCVAATWCTLKRQLGITATVITCPIDGPPGDNTLAPKTPAGCCDSGSAPAGLALVPPVAMLLRRRRRCSVGSTASRTTRSISPS